MSTLVNQLLRGLVLRDPEVQDDGTIKNTIARRLLDYDSSKKIQNYNTQLLAGRAEQGRQDEAIGQRLMRIGMGEGAESPRDAGESLRMLAPIANAIKSGMQTVRPGESILPIMEGSGLKPMFGSRTEQQTVMGPHGIPTVVNKHIPASIGWPTTKPKPSPADVQAAMQKNMPKAEVVTPDPTRQANIEKYGIGGDVLNAMKDAGELGNKTTDTLANILLRIFGAEILNRDNSSLKNYQENRPSYVPVMPQ